jgi:hypothetical protein
LAAFISVAAIMPQGAGSGKRAARFADSRFFRKAERLRSNAGAPNSDPLRLTFSMASGRPRDRNPDPRRPAHGTGICYNIAMAKQRKPIAKTGKAGGFVIGRARFAKISAVEEIQLTEVMERRASEAGRKGLKAEEYRRTIERSYRKG